MSGTKFNTSMSKLPQRIKIYKHVYVCIKYVRTCLKDRWDRCKSFGKVIVYTCVSLIHKEWII